MRRLQLADGRNMGTRARRQATARARVKEDVLTALVRSLDWIQGAEAGGNHSVYLQEGREKGTKISLFYTFLCCLNFVLGIFMHSRIIYYLFFIPQHAPWSLCPTFWLFSRGNGAAVIRRQRHANKVLVPVPWNGREICILKGTPSHFYSAL